MLSGSQIPPDYIPPELLEGCEIVKVDDRYEGENHVIDIWIKVALPVNNIKVDFLVLSKDEILDQPNASVA